MAFRATFDCLWCGASSATRSADDIEGWAQLCPVCIGRAGENPFLRSRLRAALEERGRARGEGRAGRAETGASPVLSAAAPERRLAALVAAAGPAPADDWYLGRMGGSTVIDAATWASDLDAATMWIDALPLAGRIVELEAGGGWWSPLLAAKGELWAYVGSTEDLERGRRRLVAHGLRAHLHVGPPALSTAQPADAVFAAFRLGGLADADRGALLGEIRAALRPGGSLVILDLLEASGEPAGGPPGGAGLGPHGGIEPEPLGPKLLVAGFGPVRIERTSRFFVLAHGVVPPA